MVSSSRGFTLIELMVVVAIIGMSAAAAMPFTAEWQSQADIDHFASKLTAAVSQARSNALRNPFGATAGETASRITIADSAITVSRCRPSSTCEQPATIWTSPVSSQVHIESNGAPVSSLLMNSRGQIMNAGYPFIYALTKGGYTDELPTRTLH